MVEQIKKSIKNIFKKPHFQRDLFLLVVLVPVILSLLFLLPISEKDQLILQKGSPNLLTFFTTNFIHEEASHFFNNIGSYLIIVIPLYILTFQAGERRKFYRMMLFCFVLLPFLLSFFNLLIPTKRSLGFSGIDAALLGFLPYSVFIYFKKSYNWKVSIQNTLDLAVMFSFGVILVNLLSYGFTMPKLMLLSLIWGLFLAGLVTELRTRSPKVYFSPLKQIFRKYRLIGVYLLLSLVVIYLVSLVGLFPEKIVEETVEGRIITGIHTHFAGLAFGFLVSYIFVREGFRRKKK